MSTDYRHANDYLKELLRSGSLEELSGKLGAKPQDLPPKIRNTGRLTSEAVAKRWQQLPGTARDALVDPQTLSQLECYQRNIENCIGTVKLPVGIAGPLRVNGLFAQGDYYIPLATTEAAVVASYSRGDIP